MCMCVCLFQTAEVRTELFSLKNSRNHINNLSSSPVHLKYTTNVSSFEQNWDLTDGRVHFNFSERCNFFFPTKNHLMYFSCHRFLLMGCESACLQHFLYWLPYYMKFSSLQSLFLKSRHCASRSLLNVRLM